VGQSILLNGAAYTVVGVLPTEFALPNAEVQIASPLVFETDPQRSDRGSNFLRSFALLKPGVTPMEAQAELAIITERLNQQYPNENGKHTAPRVITLRDEVVGNYHALLWTLLGAVAIVLLIACTNLANMMLVRVTARRRLRDPGRVGWNASAVDSRINHSKLAACHDWRCACARVRDVGSSAVDRDRAG